MLAQLGQQNAVESAGAINAPTDYVQVRVGGQFNSVDALRALPIRAGGASFKLGDIAEIKRGYVDPPQVKVRDQGKEVIALGISMAKGGDIIELGKALEKASAGIRAELPAGIELHQFQNQAKVVSGSVNEFVGTLIEAIVIVLAVSFVSLGLHFKPIRIDIGRAWSSRSRSRWCSRSPSSMYYWGVGLHKISLGSLIIALGLLVDDAIIAVEMMVRKLEEGYDKVRAATFAYEVTAMPMLTGTLITAVGFLPIGLAQSTVGEYTFAIFAVTAAALLISWLVSVYFVPYLGTLLLKRTSPGRVARRAARAVRHAVLQPLSRRRRLVRAAPLDHDRGDSRDARARRRRHGCRAAAVLPGFEPARDPGRPVVPRGHVVRGQRGGDQADRGPADDARRRRQRDDLGRQRRRALRARARPGVPAEQRQPDDRPAARHEGARAAAHRIARPAGHRVPRGACPRQAAAERPAGAVSGAVPRRRPRGGQVRAYADEVKAIMRTNPNLRGINDNWNESVKVLRLDVDQDKARALGVSSQSIAQAARTINGGTNVGQYRDGDKLIDIVLRQPLAERNVIAVTNLANAYVPAASGKSAPTRPRSPAALGLGAGRAVARGPRLRGHGAGRHRRRVPAGPPLATGQGNAGPASLRALMKKMPPGYRIEVAGAVEESSKGQGLDRRRRAVDAVHHVHAADAAAAQLQPLGAGVPDRAAGRGRRGRGAAAAQPAVRLRRPARRDRADGHDHAQLGDPDRPDRAEISAPRANRPGDAIIGSARAPFPTDRA